MKVIETKNNIPFNVDNNAIICLNVDYGSLDGQIILPEQTHGNNVVELINGSELLEETDGLFTGNKNLKIGVGTRDCAPVCLSDGEKIGIVHIGWRGLAGNIYENIYKHFKKKNLVVYVAPFLNKFEIKKDFCFDQLKEEFENFIIYEENKIFFNFKDALASVLPNDTIWDSRNTQDDLSLPSNRRGDKKNFITSIKFVE